MNIHPTKSQVKFRDNQPAFRAVNRCLREALEKAPWLEKGSAGVQAAVEAHAAKRLSVADLTRPYENAAPAVFKEPSLEASPVNTVGRFEAPEFSTVQFRQKPSVAAEPTPLKTPEPSQGPWSRLQVLGQANLTYIVAQDAEKIVLVDQHAAHERVAYERLMRAWFSGQIQVQAMLIPLTLELEGDGAESLMSVATDLAKLGVAIDQMGPQAVAIRTKPELIRDKALVQSLTDLAREISDRGGSFALEKKISDLCATKACHSVVRAGQALSIEQMKSLLEQMDEFSLSSFCPHGRPVSVDYPFSKLERDFGRIV